MPTYEFENKDTGEVSEDIMSISAKEAFLIANPHIQQIFTRAPPIGDIHRLGMKKPHDGFRDVLRNIKKLNPGSKVNTF